MREIKFRAWAHSDGRMLSWDSLLCNRSTFLCTLAGEPARQQLSIMQFTGLKDKNGVEIYEGDIVRHQRLVCQVVYQAPGFVMKKKAHHKKWFTFILTPTENQFEEIVGNIHENPELLK